MRHIVGPGGIRDIGTVYIIKGKSLDELVHKKEFISLEHLEDEGRERKKSVCVWGGGGGGEGSEKLRGKGGDCFKYNFQLPVIGTVCECCCTSYPHHTSYYRRRDNYRCD